MATREKKFILEPDIEPVNEQPTPQSEPQTAKSTIKLPRLERCPHCGSLHKPYFSYKKRNNYSYTRLHFGSDPQEWTVAILRCRDCGGKIEEYFDGHYGSSFPTRQEAMKKVVGTWCLKSAMADKTTWKFRPESTPCVYASDNQTEPNQQPATIEPATINESEHQPKPAQETPARKSALKPATRKPRNVKKIDDSRQLLIQFDDAETPATIQPAKPKPRRVFRPRVKRNYSQQLLIDFGEDIPDGQTNKTKAA